MFLLGNTNNKDCFCFIKFPLGPTAEFCQYIVGLFNQPHFHLASISFSFNIHTFLQLVKRQRRWEPGLGIDSGPQGGFNSEAAKLFYRYLCQE